MSGTAMAWSPASRRGGSREAAAPDTDGHRSTRSGGLRAGASPCKEQGVSRRTWCSRPPRRVGEISPAEMSGEMRLI